MSEKRTHGGRRLGAGRKPTGIVPLMIYPKKQTATILRRMAKSQKRTLGQLVDEIIGVGIKP
jgi:hypothetical protein